MEGKLTGDHAFQRRRERKEGDSQETLKARRRALDGKIQSKEHTRGAPIVAQRKRFRLGTMRLRVRSLASFSGLRIRCCRELCEGHRHSSDLEWLWLWCRPAVTAQIGPLAWEPHMPRMRP